MASTSETAAMRGTSRPDNVPARPAWCSWPAAPCSRSPSPARAAHGPLVFSSKVFRSHGAADLDRGRSLPPVTLFNLHGVAATRDPSAKARLRSGATGQSSAVLEGTSVLTVAQGANVQTVQTAQAQAGSASAPTSATAESRIASRRGSRRGGRLVNHRCDEGTLSRL